MAYFLEFSLIDYDIRGDGVIQRVTDIATRVKLRDEIKNNVVFWDEYDVREGERPETIAFNLYSDAERHWIILLANDIVNPYYDWPLSYLELERYLTKKYGTVEAINAVHHYESFGDSTVPDGMIVDSTFVNKISVSNRDYETALNEAKRRIRLIKPVYVSEIEQEFIDLVK